MATSYYQWDNDEKNNDKKRMVMSWSMNMYASRILYQLNCNKLTYQYVPCNVFNDEDKNLENKTRKINMDEKNDKIL